MYSPPKYRWDDLEAARALVTAHNFALLVTVVDGAPMATHLPFLIDPERNLLRAHLARANPQAACLDGAEHLVVFTGPHAYISPDWYGETKDVPTWNYLAVHVAGRARVVEDERAVDQFLADLSAHEESRRHDLPHGRTWTTDRVPEKDHARMRAAIVAFEIDVDRIEAKAKLNQNKPDSAVRGVVEALSASGSDTQAALAQAMAKELERRR